MGGQAGGRKVSGGGGRCARAPRGGAPPPPPCRGPWVKATPRTPTPRCHPIPGVRDTMPPIPGPQQCRFDGLPWGQGSPKHVPEGAVEPSKEPLLLRGFTPGPGQPFASPCGGSVSSVWKAGAWPGGLARAREHTEPRTQSASKRCSAASRLSPGEVEGPGPWPRAARSPCGQGVARPQPGGA